MNTNLTIQIKSIPNLTITLFEIADERKAPAVPAKPL
jgi:hypothetical protein